MYMQVLYFGVPPDADGGGASRLYDRFCAGSDAFRNARLRLQPSVVEGPWQVLLSLMAC